jgi:hypothetical protein
MSLKDALAKAMQERENAAPPASTENIEARKEEAEEKKKREVDEATLRKLILEE